ncbi:hypothetical protein CDD83_1458 [Cordyceps sp. RAO-2017]|nr:hypothetical protein CDD83_1458 [Cordyceps sp. RAO-2017]
MTEHALYAKKAAPATLSPVSCFRRPLSGVLPRTDGLAGLVGVVPWPSEEGERGAVSRGCLAVVCQFAAASAFPLDDRLREKLQPHTTCPRTYVHTISVHPAVASRPAAMYLGMYVGLISSPSRGRWLLAGGLAAIHDPTSAGPVPDRLVSLHPLHVHSRLQTRPPPPRLGRRPNSSVLVLVLPAVPCPVPPAGPQLDSLSRPRLHSLSRGATSTFPLPSHPPLAALSLAACVSSCPAASSEQYLVPKACTGPREPSRAHLITVHLFYLIDSQRSPLSIAHKDEGIAIAIAIAIAIRLSLASRPAAC